LNLQIFFMLVNARDEPHGKAYTTAIANKENACECKENACE